MKKNYNRPMMNVEAFVCDEYVSGCADTVNKYYEFVCDSNYGMEGRANTNFRFHWFNYYGDWMYEFCYRTIYRKQQKRGFSAILVYQHLDS